MVQTKFEIGDTGFQFLYDNTNNGLYQTNGIPLTPAYINPEEWDQLKDRFGATHVVRNPETIKISLGQGCNYSCEYCMQKDIGNPEERPPNGLTPMLIKNIERHLDVSEVTRFELWGGETLLYWNDVVPLMEQFDREGITWYIPTNGTPLKKKHIDFFKQLKGKVAMGISHDGPGHEALRGKEFLHKKVEVFQQIAEECPQQVQYSFNPVISRTNYNLFAINDFFVEYFDKHQLPYKQLSYELGRVYDRKMSVNSMQHVLQGDDLVKYQTILTNYLNAHIDQYKRLGETTQGPLLANSLFHTGMGVLPYARSLQTHKKPLLKSNCGVDDSRLITMDLLGNVRTCPNVDESHTGGNIMMLKGIKIHGVNLNRDSHCGSCEVKLLCKSSCPLDLGEAVWFTNCAVEKTHYRAIQLAAFKLVFGHTVQKVI